MQGEARQARKGEEHSRQGKSSHNGNTVLTLEERGQWSKGMRPGWGRTFTLNVVESQRTVPTREVTGLCWVLAAKEAVMGGGGRVEVEEAEDAKRVSSNKKLG